MPAQVKRGDAGAQAERGQHRLVGHRVETGRMQPDGGIGLDRIAELDPGHLPAGFHVFAETAHQAAAPNTLRRRSVVRAKGFSRIFFSSSAT